MTKTLELLEAIDKEIKESKLLEAELAEKNDDESTIKLLNLMFRQLELKRAKSMLEIQLLLLESQGLKRRNSSDNYENFMKKFVIGYK